MSSKGKKRELTITVSIPTAYGGESLVETAKSIHASENISPFRFIIVADRTPISKSIKKGLQDMGVELYWNEKEGSQFKKIKQMIDMAKGDIFISTQDDIIFPPLTIAAIVKTFQEDSQLTMLGARVLPLEPQTFFESIMASMIRVVDRIGGHWNEKQNYLMANGRCLAFRTGHLKKFRIPEKIVNGDMFLYLENKRLGGTFMRPNEAVVYIRPPQKVKDQTGPSSRFQYSEQEMTGIFGPETAKEYRIPKLALFMGTLEEFLRHPISMGLYPFVYLYTRLKKQPQSKVTNPVWDIDTSTKQIKHRL